MEGYCSNRTFCIGKLNVVIIRLRDRNLQEFGKNYLEIGYLWLRPVEQVLGLVQSELFVHAFTQD